MHSKCRVIVQTWPPGGEDQCANNQKVLAFSLDDVRNSKNGRKGNTNYECVENIYYNLEKSFGRALRRTSAQEG